MNLGKRMEDNLAAGVLLAVFVLAVVIAAGYGSRARLVPVAIAVTAIVLVLAQITVQNLTRRPAAADAAPEQRPGGTQGGSLLGGIGIVAILVAGILLVGLLPAILLYVFGYLKWVAMTRTVLAAGYAIAAWGVLYLLFALFLGIPLYTGLFDLWIPVLSG